LNGLVLCLAKAHTKVCQVEELLEKMQINKEFEYYSAGDSEPSRLPFGTFDDVSLHIRPTGRYKLTLRNLRNQHTIENEWEETRERGNGPGERSRSILSRV